MDGYKSHFDVGLERVMNSHINLYKASKDSGLSLTDYILHKGQYNPPTNKSPTKADLSRQRMERLEANCAETNKNKK